MCQMSCLEEENLYAFKSFQKGFPNTLPVFSLTGSPASNSGHRLSQCCGRVGSGRVGSLKQAQSCLTPHRATVSTLQGNLSMNSLFIFFSLCTLSLDKSILILKKLHQLVSLLFLLSHYRAGWGYVDLGINPLLRFMITQMCVPKAHCL